MTKPRTIPVLKFATLTGLSLIPLLLLTLLIFDQSLPAIPLYENFKTRFISSDRLLLDRHEQPLHEIRVDHQVRRMAWTPLRDLSDTLTQSVILAEDKRFLNHPGVDIISLGHALWQRLISSSKRGASTITMQVTEYLGSTTGKKNLHRGLKDKLKQILLAFELERKWSKVQILEAYFNLLQFKGELQGIGATSYGLFEKNPRHLSLYESVVLTVLIRAPNATAEKLLRRACTHLHLLKPRENCGENIHSVIQQVLKKNYSIQALVQEAPHVARQLQAMGEFKERSDIKTTLDLSLQKMASESLRKQVLGLKEQNMNDGAVVILENATGDVLAYVGNIGPKSSAVYVDGAKALRQAGSTLKPFIYGLAFDRRVLTPASVIDDSPLEISEQSGLYRPQNYDRSFRSMVTVRNALASSLNIPAVKAVEMVGIGDFLQTLQQLGMSNLEREDFYGPSIALGSADVKLIELVNAYRTLANRGLWSPVRWTADQLSHPELNPRVFSEESSFLIADILSDREARSSTFGLENMLSTRFWTAVKTGTSKDMRDNWCVGFSSKYTVGVWTGNFSGSPMWNVSGIQGAAPVWLEIMNNLHQTESSITPSLPKGVIQKRVDFTFLKQKRLERFITGTEPPDGRISLDTKATTKIAYPQPHSYIALDPDIPKTNQKVFFNISNPGNGHRILLNKMDLGPAKAYMLWHPQKGKFQLELKDRMGMTIDQVDFEVRGRF